MLKIWLIKLSFSAGSEIMQKSVMTVDCGVLTNILSLRNMIRITQAQ